jgi:hypothetical protein
MNTLRRIDVISRRRIRQAVIAWHTLAVRCAMQFTRLACALPSSRQTQDRAMYVVAAVGCAVALHVSVYRG